MPHGQTQDTQRGTPTPPRKQRARTQTPIAATAPTPEPTDQWTTTLQPLAPTQLELPIPPTPLLPTPMGRQPHLAPHPTTSTPQTAHELPPPDQQLRCYASHDIAPLRGTVGSHRAHRIA